MTSNKTAALCAVFALGLGAFGCGDDSDGGSGGAGASSAAGTGSSTATAGTAASSGAQGTGGDGTGASGTGGDGTGASGTGGDGTGGDGTGGDGTGGAGTGGDGAGGGGTSAPAGSSTGNITECQPDAESCNDPCAEARAAGPGNCMVFVSNRYSMAVDSNNVDQCGVTVALSFNGGTPGEGDHAVVGVNDFTAGGVAVQWNGGPDGSIEFAESGNVTVSVDGAEITATFEDLPFPAGGSISGDITCH